MSSGTQHAGGEHGQLGEGPAFAFDNTYARELDGAYVPWQATPVPEPELLLLNQQLAERLGLDVEALSGCAGAEIFAGNRAVLGAQPLAQAYAGHQFGGFVPQLGDGRALLLGEVVAPDGSRFDVQLKGSGPTPFSRGGDGKAPLGPVLREYLMGEAMHALGIPTTRALAAVSTGESVVRDTVQPGGILTRVAASHVRVGTFQFFAARGDFDKVRRLADYVIARHDSDLDESYPLDAEPSAEDSRYVQLLIRVRDRQAALVAQWMSVGFIHGVMNTDNTSIAGETIDFGPCAFMDRFDPATVFSSIDHHGRYAYANQPPIAQWNLARFAETLVPLLDTDKTKALDLANEVVVSFQEAYHHQWLRRFAAKLGITDPRPEDQGLIEELHERMAEHELDFTQTYRALTTSLLNANSPSEPSALGAWSERWRERLGDEDSRSKAAALMERSNPRYIPRNHLVEEALESAVANSDLSPFEKLLAVLEEPFGRRDGYERYEQPDSADAPRYRTFCGT